MSKEDNTSTSNDSHDKNNNSENLNDQYLQTTVIDKQLTQDFITYAYAVITDRALPSIDGLKPVTRKILYVMHMINSAKYIKSAEVVGEVLGKYHPHGDSSIYGALVRIAQNWSLLYPLIDSQGNFGSIDGDEPASMRYTGVKSSKLFKYIFQDLDKDTVTFVKNYDDTKTFPSLLPVRFPNLLLNGTIGIAVGMATSIPSHNLQELINALVFIIDNPDANMNDAADSKSIFQFIKGPDFPTGGIVFGKENMMQGYRTGKGICKIRGKYTIKDNQIIIHEIPYMTNKSKIIENIAEAVKSKKIEGISQLRDESDDQIRIKIIVKRYFSPEIIINQIFKHTLLETSFSINLLVLMRGRPVLMNLLEMLKSFINFREEVVLRRSFHLLQLARKKLLNLMILNLICEEIDLVVNTIKKSTNTQDAITNLQAMKWNVHDLTSSIIDHIMNSNNLTFYTQDLELLTTFNKSKQINLNNYDERNRIFQLDEKQARFILDMKLSKLTSLERNKIKDNILELFEDIKKLSDVLISKDRVMQLIKEEFLELESFYVNRKTSISDASYALEEEELIVKEDRVITITHDGYIKTTSLTDYKTQNRGGKGRTGADVKKMDNITSLFIGHTHTTILFFSNFGRVYAKKVYRLPKRDMVSRGMPLVNFISIDENEKITSTLVLPDNINTDMYLIFATKYGKVRKSRLLDFIKIQNNGKIAIKLQEEDILISVNLASNYDYVFLATELGKAIKFRVASLRLCKSRDSIGVNGMNLQEHDIIKSLSILKNILNQNLQQVGRADQDDMKFLADNKSNGDNNDESDSDDGSDSEYSTNEITEQKQQLNIEDQYLDIYMTIPVNTRMRYKKNKSLLKDVEGIPRDILIQLIDNEIFILTITANGYGKKTSSYEYRITSRGGRGISNANNLKKIGYIVECLSVTSGNQIIVITNKAKVIRCNIDDIRSTGRSTSGVRICKLNVDEKIVSAELVLIDDCLDDELDTANDSDNKIEDKDTEKDSVK
ncbi:MAG: DNA gyrase subunit A [Pseudomonadota bacterium]